MVGRRGNFAWLLQRIAFILPLNGLHKRKFAFLLFLAIIIFCQVVIVTKVLFVKTASRSQSIRSAQGPNATRITPATAKPSKKRHDHEIPEHGNLTREKKYRTKKNRKRLMRLQRQQVILSTPATPSNTESSDEHTKVIVPTVTAQENIQENGTIVNSSATLPPTLDYRILHEYWPPVNFTLVNPHIAPQIDEELYLLILINSGVHSKSNTDRRNAIRRTWANKRVQLENMAFGSGAKHGFPFKTPLARPFKVVFLLGKSYNETIDREIEDEAKQHNDLVIGAFPDNYINLIIKVYMGFKWAHENVKSKFILKGDDDTYIYIPRLTALLESVPDRFFGGYVMTNAQVFRDVNNKHGISKLFFGEKVYPPYCGGPFYVFSKNLVPDFLRLTSHIRPFHIEDAYIGILLRYMGMRPAFIPGFYLNDWMPGSIRTFKPCEWATAIAIGHKLESPLIEYVHSKLPHVDPSRLSSKDWQACRRRHIPRNDNILSAVYGILISLSMILVYVTVAFLPSNYEVYDDRPFVYRRQNYYPHVYRAGR